MKVVIAFICLVIMCSCRVEAAETNTSSQQINSAFGPFVRLSHENVEAVISVPLGRVVWYGFSGRHNLLWLSPISGGEPIKYGDWKNWGGERTWLAPQGQWTAMNGSGWPPDTAWGEKFLLNARGGNRSKTIVVTNSMTSKTGIRISRSFRFDDHGDLLITQSADKVSGVPVIASIWHIGQVDDPDAVYVAGRNPSVYAGGFYTMTPGAFLSRQTDDTDNLRLLELTTPGRVQFKIGVNAPSATIVSLHKGIAFVQSSSRPEGEYPDGAVGSGFPVEVYSSGDANGRFVELELLSPMRLMSVKSKWTTTVRWHIEPVPSNASVGPERDIYVKGLFAATH